MEPYPAQYNEAYAVQQPPNDGQNGQQKSIQQPPPQYGAQPGYPGQQQVGYPPPGAYGQQPMYGQPGQVVIVQQQPVQLQNRVIRQGAVYGLGITACVLGVIAFILNCATSGKYGWHMGGTGYWGGLMNVIAGVLGIAVGRKGADTGLITGCMVASIIASVVSFISMAVASWYSSQVLSWLIFTNSGDIRGMYALAVTESLVLFVAFIINIIEASFCCSCCFAYQA